MNKNFSLYLDIVRFVAALAVFLDHLSSKPFTENVLFHAFGLYGQLAVIVFFVLSGYVIAFVTATKELDAKSFFVARVSRIYSVVILALVLTLLLDNIGMIFNGDFYQIKKVMWKPQSTEGYLASIFFVNEYQLFGFNGISPGSNGPYWSLSFEVTYYLIAGLIIYLSPAWSIPLTLILLTIAGVTISALFPIWVLGYFLYFYKINLSKNIYIYVTAILSAILLVLAPKIAAHLPSDNWGYYLPWGRGPFNRNILFDYLVAILFAIHLISVRTILNRVAEFTNETVKQYIRAAGLVTFPLYLIHYPILCFASAVSPWSSDSIFNLVYLVVTTIVLVIIATISSRYLQDAFKARLRKPLLP